VGQAGKAGRPDLSTTHDNYLAKKEKEGWGKK